MAALADRDRRGDALHRIGREAAPGIAGPQVRPQSPEDARHHQLPEAPPPPDMPPPPDQPPPGLPPLQPPPPPKPPPGKPPQPPWRAKRPPPPEASPRKKPIAAPTPPISTAAEISQATPPLAAPP